MNVISAYLTRQVNGGGGVDAFKKKHLNKLKQAVMTGNFTAFIETLYLKLVPDIQVDLINNYGEERERQNAYVAGKLGEGWMWSDIAHAQAFFKGSSWVVGGRDGLKACLHHFYGQETPSTQGQRCIVRNSAVAGICGLLCLIDPLEQMTPAALDVYTETYETGGAYSQTWCRLTALTTIPIFSNAQAAQMYMSRVNTYIDSKSDNDLQSISDLMDSDLYEYEYE